MHGDGCDGGAVAAEVPQEGVVVGAEVADIVWSLMLASGAYNDFDGRKRRGGHGGIEQEREREWAGITHRLSQ